MIECGEIPPVKGNKNYLILHPDRRQAGRGDHRRARRLVGRVGRVGDHRRRPRLAARQPDGDWVSMAVVSDGSYGVPEGLISSFPVTTKGGDWTIVHRAWRSTSSPAAGSTNRPPSSPTSAARSPSSA